MEFVALSTDVLNTLAKEDRCLKRMFQGVYPAGRLPRNPNTKVRQAYIVNTDPAGEPGQHWLGIWTEGNECEVFDSYGLPLTQYSDPDLHRWWSQWPVIQRSDTSLQALDSQTCGHYVLFYLKAKARGESLQDFLARWNINNLVMNDQRVAEQMTKLIKSEVREMLEKPQDHEQCNCSYQSFLCCQNQ